MATWLWCSVNVFGAVSSGVDTARDSRGWRIEELLLHVGFFDKHTGRPQQNDTVEHLQSDHPAHKHTCTENIETNIKNYKHQETYQTSVQNLETRT